jgi:hypothetical protein
VGDERTLVRRRLIEEVEKQAAMYPLVFLVGDGGSGKSVLATQYLRNEAARRFVAAKVASVVESDWPSRLLNVWRSPGRSFSLVIEPMAGVVGRLRHANRNMSPPILVLDLDGIDEIPLEHQHVTRSLINHFWSTSRTEVADAVLLVTCRTAKTTPARAIDELVRQWTVSDIFHGLSDRVGKVFVGDFSAEELSEAAQLLGEDYRRRLGPTLAWVRQVDLEQTGLGGELFPTAMFRPVSLAMVGSLRQPAMWGTFVGLPPDRRHEALDEKPLALSELAGRFLMRFCEKANRRRATLTGERILRGLRAICAAIPGVPSELTRQKHWIEPARGPMMDEEAAYLFEEANSYGLIIEDERGQWAWRHDFVCGYLKGR